MKIFKSVKQCIYGVAVGVPLAVTFFSEVGGVSEITGRSMRPTFNPEQSLSHDKVWTSRWSIGRSYRPQPGDVITLCSPIDLKKRLVKRVLAVEGEVIRSNNYKLKYVRIPKGHCWVEGDNTRSSQDSNYFGPVSVGLITGRVTHIVWPPHRWRQVSNHLHPQQNERLCEKDLNLDSEEVDMLNSLYEHSDKS